MSSSYFRTNVYRQVHTETCAIVLFKVLLMWRDDIKYFLLDEILDVRKRANMPSTANTKRETKTKSHVDLESKRARIYKLASFYVP
jgi:hypothetical protein